MACHGAGGGQAVSNYSNVHGVAYGKQHPPPCT